MLIIYGQAKSRTGRVIWAAEELGLPYELKVLNMRGGEHRQEPFLSINPAGKVPAIQDGDFVLSESAAIVSYLADKHARMGLIPTPATQTRARHDQWMAFAINDLDPPLWAIFRQILFLPEEQRSQDIQKAGESDFARAAGVLSKHFERSPYALGDNFQVADIMISSILNWATYSQMPGLDAPIRAFIKRTQERPAYQRMAEKYFKD